MHRLLKVSQKPNLLGPIYIKIQPYTHSYCGMSYKNHKALFKTITGTFRESRTVFDLMHRIAKKNILKCTNEQLDQKYSPFVYYFELHPSKINELTVYKCVFPVIFPNEDVKVIDTLITSTKQKKVPWS
jgi:hypothetical protein